MSVGVAVGGGVGVAVGVGVGVAVGGGVGVAVGVGVGVGIGVAVGVGVGVKLGVGASSTQEISKTATTPVNTCTKNVLGLERQRIICPLIDRQDQRRIILQTSLSSVSLLSSYLILHSLYHLL